MSSTRDIYIDSSRRDKKLYPTSNSYTLFLQTPLKNITQVDLVTAVVPNTVYNIVNSRLMTLHDTSLNTDGDVLVNPGFYSPTSLINALRFPDLLKTFSLTASMSEGLFIVSYSNPFTITYVDTNFSLLTKITLGTSTLDTQSGLYYVKTNMVFDFNILTNYIFLDIPQFRQPYPVDAGKTNISSNLTPNIETQSCVSFATIPVDVNSGSMKVFKEMSDYKISVHYPKPIDSVDRISIAWFDTNGSSLNFNGIDNSIILRCHINEHIFEYESPKPEKSKKTIYFYMLIFLFMFGFILLV